MEHFHWFSILAFCVLAFFIFIMGGTRVGFSSLGDVPSDEESQKTAAFLRRYSGPLGGLGLLSAIAYLIHYGYTIAWWMPFPIMAIAFFANIFPVSALMMNQPLYLMLLCRFGGIAIPVSAFLAFYWM